MPPVELPIATPINVNTASGLLLGLRLLGGDDWFAQQCEATFGPPPRMLATLFGGRLGERTLDTALACVDAGRWPDEDWPNSREPPPVEGVPWPRRAGRGEVSASAARLLRYAGNRARSRDGAAIEVLDLIAAYVLDAHGHERQLESYGFELQVLRAAFAAHEAAAAATAPPASRASCGGSSPAASSPRAIWRPCRATPASPWPMTFCHRLERR